MQVLLESLRALRERSPDARILDVGGSYAPCRSATHIVDILPFSALMRANAYGDGELRVTPETYHQLDICAARFPFPDKSVDFVICRHTLEDLRDPIAVCREMNRVGRSGYVECPSRVYESTKGVERPWWAGHYHHRSFLEVTGARIDFQFKPHNLSSARAFHFRRWPWQQMRDRYRVVSLSWSGSFEYAEGVILDYNEVKDNLRAFKRAHADLPLFRLRWAKEG
jgi:hypothetical protein